MTVVECRGQSNVPRQQHAVTEDIAAHVADAHHREVLGLGVDAHLSEVTFDRLPGASGRDAHRLVVVSGRTAGGERIPEPEPVLPRNIVGDVGERGGALVRGDHQVGIVIVAAYHPRGRGDVPRFLVDVVGEVEQS